MIVSIQKPGLPASGGLMAGSVFSKIAERVYAKDLRLPLTNAIDTNSVVIPNVKPERCAKLNEYWKSCRLTYKAKSLIQAKRFGEIPILPTSCGS